MNPAPYKKRKKLTHSAFNIPKFSQDFSQARMLFTYEIPDPTCSIVEKINDVITSPILNENAQFIRSENGEGVFESGPNIGDIGVVHTRVHVSLQPNRGLLDSFSAFCDSWDLPGAECEAGFFNIDDETIQVIDAVTLVYRFKELYLRVVSLGVQVGEDIHIPKEDYARIDELFHASKGHLVDLQGEWRGVGNFFAYLSSVYDADSECIAAYDVINRLDNLSISNPSLHAGFILRNKGDIARMRSGCLDVSIEGGNDIKKTRFSISTGTRVTVSSAGTVLLALKLPRRYKDVFNSRDVQLYEVSCSSDKVGDFKAYRVYDQASLLKAGGVPVNDADWQTKPGGSSLQFISNTNAIITAFDDTDALEFIDLPLAANSPLIYPLIAPQEIPEIIIHDEIIVFVGEGNIASMKVTVVYSEPL